MTSKSALLSLATEYPTVKKVTGREFLWKSEISKHISTRDPRAATMSIL